MSNHIHILIDTSIQTPQIIEPNQIHDPYVQVDKIMKRIKGASARYSNALLNLSGQFWERESFDIYIRNTKMLRNVINYILNNPVKAGIVKSWEDHPFTYLKNYKV